METSNFSLHKYAHLFILALTLLVFCAGSAARFKQISNDPAYAWFGYAPASIQPFVPVEYQIPAQLENSYAQSISNDTSHFTQ